MIVVVVGELLSNKENKSDDADCFGGSDFCVVRTGGELVAG